MQRRFIARSLALGAVLCLVLGFGPSAAFAASAPRAAAVSTPHSVAGTRTTRTAAIPRESGSIGVIVRFKHPSTAFLGAKLLSEVTGSAAAPCDQARGLYTFRRPYNQPDDGVYAASLMLAASGIDYAEPNCLNHIDAYTPPTDPYFTNTETWYSGSDYYLNAKHWWLDSIKAANAWSTGQGTTYPTHGSASDVKVAVLDVGFYLSHPDLSGGSVTAGKDECASFDPNTGDTTTDTNVTPDSTGDPDHDSHGTGVAAAVGAEVNGVGMVGSGWNPQIVAYKIAGPLTSDYFDGSDYYYAGEVVMPDSVTAQGIYDAVDAGCKVINLSLGAASDSYHTYQDAVTYAHQHGVVVVASAGNDGGAVAEYPAACAYATGVGAIKLSGGSGTQNGTPTRADFSDYAPGVVDLVAPGTMFWTADEPGYDSDGSESAAVPGYQFWDGTSFASPAAAGAIAYLWRAMPDLTNDEIVSYAENTATDMGTAGRDDYYGYGLVNMQAAYNKLISDYPMLATPVISGSSYVHSGSSVSWTASSGYNVSYQVSIDGALRSTQTSTTYVLPSLSDGSHVISVLPTSTRNWNTTTAPATKTLTVDSTPPSVSGFSLAGSEVSWSVTEANLYAVQAYVDDGSPATVTVNSFDVSGLTAGSHTMHVRATDEAGNSSGWVTWDFTYDVTPPAFSDFSIHDDTITWTVSETSTYTVQAYVDAATPVDVAGDTLDVTGLSAGLHTLHVDGVDALGNDSGWVSWQFSVGSVPPSLTSQTVTDAVSVVVSWPPVADATGYDYKIEGAASEASATTTSTSLTVSGMTGDDVVTIQVRTVFSGGVTTDWATATVTDNVVVPATPVPTAPGLVHTPSVDVSWAAAADARSYEYRVNGGSVTATTALSAAVGGLAVGENTISVRSLNNFRESVWGTTTVTYAPDVYWSVYRFRNLKNGYYLWTASEVEKNNIVATMAKTWTLEGVAYRINTTTNTSPLWRFRNLKSGFYLYTSDANEKNSIVANLSRYYKLEGVAYNVSRTTGSPVWRFQNLKDGTYLYSADPNEKANIVAKLSKTWKLEGVAYLIAP